MFHGRQGRLLSILITGLIFLATGCSSVEPARFDVSLDESDLITYQFGGGELGADFTRLTIRGDGHISYRYLLPSTGAWPQEEITKERQLSPAETEAFFQGLVEAGLFNLESQAPQGEDIPRTTITANVDHRQLEISLAGTPDQAIHSQITGLIEQIHPAATCQVNDFTGNLAKISPGASRTEVILCLDQPAELNQYELPAPPSFGPSESLASILEPETPIEEWVYYGNENAYYLWFASPTAEPPENWRLVEKAVYPQGAVFESQ